MSHRRRLPWSIALGLVAFLLTSSAQSQVLIKVNDNVFMRFGILLQAWADEQQDATTRGYVQNLYIRRARFIASGQVTRNVSFFFQTDNGNAGKVPKALGSGFTLVDAWAEWRVADALAISAGEFIVPLSRGTLGSSRVFLCLDISATSSVFSVPTQSNSLRDTGVQAKGYVADGRLEYRAAVFQGIRSVGGRNSFRRSAYLQYDFSEKERGYVFPDTNFGRRKIVALSTGYDGQDRYYAWTANGLANIPVNHGDEFAGILQHNRYNGGSFIAALPNQRDELLAVGYYLHAIKLQPFAKFEQQRFSLAADRSRDQRRWGTGAHYYVRGQNMKITAQYFRVIPANRAINPTNEFTVELQFGYY